MEVARRQALGGIAGPALFWVAIVVGAALEADYLGNDAYRPGLRGGYSHVYSFVSELAADGSGVQSLMIAGFFAFGIGTLFLVASLRSLWPTATALTMAVFVSAVGILGAGSFPCDVGCPVDGDVSTSQTLHNLFSVVTFPAWMACAAIAAWQLRRTLYGRLSLVLAVVQVGTGLLLGTWRDREMDDPVGLLQRINLAAVALWFVLTAVELRRQSGRSQATQ